MAVRNFWLNGRIDGRKHVVTGGPAAADGGMDITVFVREQGDSTEAFSFLCRNEGDYNVVTVLDAGGNVVDQLRVTR